MKYSGAMATLTGMRYALVLVALAGCSSPTLPVASESATVPTVAPFCVYDTTAPTNTSGEISYAARPPHTDCVPPDGGEVFSLGFATDGWWLQLDAVRSQFTVGQPMRFEDTDQAALLALDCWTWIGEFVVTQDDAAGWSVFIDATCADDASKHVVGQWSD